MKKIKLSVIMLCLSLIFLSSCGNPKSAINYSMDGFIPSFNKLLQSMRLGNYVFEDSQVNKLSSSLLLAENDHIRVRLIMDERDNRKLKSFEFVAREDLNKRDFELILKLIADSFKNSNSYAKENVNAFGGKGAGYKLK